MAQSRERVYFIGILKALHPSKKKREQMFRDLWESIQAMGEAMAEASSCTLEQIRNYTRSVIQGLGQEMTFPSPALASPLQLLRFIIFQFGAPEFQGPQGPSIAKHFSWCFNLEFPEFKDFQGIFINSFSLFINSSKRFHIVSQSFLAANQGAKLFLKWGMQLIG